MESPSTQRASKAAYVSKIMTAPVEREEPRGLRWWLVIAPVAFLAIAISLIVPATRHQWAVAIFRQPTRFTALSFEKAWAMPVVVVTGKPLSVAFVIDNQEGRTLHYRYVISETSPGKSATLAHSTRTVEAGRSSSVRVVIRPTCVVSPCRIQVSLPGNPETIDFLTAVGS